MDHRIFRVLDRLLALVLCLALIGVSSSIIPTVQAAAPLQRSENQVCIFAVTPSSGVAVQFNSTTTMGGASSNCAFYNEICWTNESSVSGDTVYLSSYNVTNSSYGWPSVKGSYECHDQTIGVPVWYFQRADQVGQIGTLKFRVSY